MWVKVRKLASPRNILYSLVSLILFSLFYMAIEWKYQNTSTIKRSDTPGHLFVKPCVRNDFVKQQSSPESYPDIQEARQKALVFLRQSHTQVGRDITTALQSARFKFYSISGEVRSLPPLVDDNKGRFAVIIFDDYFHYTSLSERNREILDKYCQDFNVGIIYFLRPSLKSRTDQEFSLVQQVGDFPLKYASNLKMKNYELDASSPVLRIARPGKVVEGMLPAPNDWTVFEFDHPTYKAISHAKLLPRQEYPASMQKRGKQWARARKYLQQSGRILDADPSRLASVLIKEDTSAKLVTVVEDQGDLDGVKRIFFGGTLKFWLHKVLFLDALSYMSSGRLSLPLERHVQIDIDDMFVGVSGYRMYPDDVKALVQFQDELREIIPGFTFQLGFSGKFIFSGDEKETEADRLLLKLHDKFSWFPHMWSHMQGHWFNNVTFLCEYMDINRQFSVRHHLNMSRGYAVAPHHAGVFPVHQPLYDCWHKVWNITCTSTEEYPHLRPDCGRRGFIYDNVMVLPRQTCGLFTHTTELGKFPGGPSALNTIIHGGSLFNSFLYNQFNIFMTHLSNYGRDRLGIYTFDRAIKFVHCWTNIKLVYEPPHEVARKYFELYPEEKDVVWTNPCLDKRHMEIWSEQKTCERLPNFVVVGPQKTGTTALYWFLTMHPHVLSNYPSKTTFEEVQFFTGPNYFKGIEWYMDYFPLPNNQTILFEKSATYFDQRVAPKRIWSLLPKQKIVVILIDPGRRAYSWYQHMRSHEDPTALNYSFYDVIHAPRQGTPPALISLQRRCLDPGFYAYNLVHWFEYFDSEQVVIVDGDLLKENPVKVMKQVQLDLGFQKRIDYNTLLRYDKKKGFFCKVLKNNKVKCLGKSKGRPYNDMDDKSRRFLAKYYRSANSKLLKLLKSTNKDPPSWLLANHHP